LSNTIVIQWNIIFLKNTLSLLSHFPTPYSSPHGSRQLSLSLSLSLSLTIKIRGLNKLNTKSMKSTNTESTKSSTQKHWETDTTEERD
jgi:hypothetical protein